MSPVWPRVWGTPEVSAVIRAQNEDFIVREQLGFELSGEGEHVFLYLEKRGLNTLELLDRLSQLSGVAVRDIGYCGMKDRNAVTFQWFSVGLAGKEEPQWRKLELPGDVKVLELGRHQRKLRRGVHRANQFELRLTALEGESLDLRKRLQRVAAQGVPNYFGEQRFGRNGQTLLQARKWLGSNGRKVTRNKRSLFLSALRSHLFNELLAARVARQSWNQVLDGDVCMLQGSRSRFSSSTGDEEIAARVAAGDIHPGLPLWGKGEQEAGSERVQEQRLDIATQASVCEFLERQGLELNYRSARLMPDDFCWEFCDDALRLRFELSPGGYATAVLAELVQYNEGNRSGSGSE